MTGRARTGEWVPDAQQATTAWFEATDGRELADGRSAPQVGKSRTLTLAPTGPPPAERQPSETQPASADENGQEAAAEEPESDGMEEAQKHEQPAPESESGADGARETVPQAQSTTTQATSEPAEGAAAPEGAKSPGDEFEKELERFVREHGESAGEAAQAAAKRDEAASDPGGADGKAGPEAASSQPASSPSAPRAGESAGPASQPAGGGESGNADAAGDPATGQPRSNPGKNGASSGADRGGPARDPPTDETGVHEANKPTGSRNGAGPGAAAGGTSPGHGGGAANDGAPPEEEAKPRRAAPPAPPPAAPHRKSNPLEPTGLVETLNLLEMLERGQAVTEDMLTDAGWPAVKAAAFVRALERLHIAAEPSEGGALRRLRAGAQLGSAARQTGRGLSRALDHRVRGVEAAHDDLKRIAPPPDQKVPVGLEPLLDAYYRSLAAQPSRGGS
jgi:hypothetical protein